MGSRVSSPAFVGRLEELQVLEAARRRAADGEPAVVLVGGEAGVGKTRLVTELATHCTSDGIRVLYGGCIPVGEGTLPYAPVVEALRALLADLGADRMRALIGPSWPELARLLPGLGQPGGDPPGQAAQTRLFELLLGLLGRLSDQAPLVLVVEDVHWADRPVRDQVAAPGGRVHLDVGGMACRAHEPGSLPTLSSQCEPPFDPTGQIDRNYRTTPVQQAPRRRAYQFRDSLEIGVPGADRCPKRLRPDHLVQLPDQRHNDRGSTRRAHRARSVSDTRWGATCSRRSRHCLSSDLRHCERARHHRRTSAASRCQPAA